MFSSVKNWLTLLIVALVALAMLVAWVYVVPPLQGRLTSQKLAEARGNARLVSTTLTSPGLLNYDKAHQRPTVTDLDAVTNTLNSISSRFSGRAIIYTRGRSPSWTRPTRPHRTWSTIPC